MIGDIGLYIYCLPMNIIIILMIFGIVLWSLLGFLLKRYGRIWKAVNFAVLFFEIVAVIYMTITSRERESSYLALIPFQSLIEALEQPEIYRSMLMNVLFFLPFGLTIPWVLPEKMFSGKIFRRALFAVLIALLFSALIETVQYVFQLGRTETDDVICNSLGAGLGALAYCLANISIFNRKNKHTDISPD